MAEANRNDETPDPGTPEEALTPDERSPISADVQAVIDREFGDDDPDQADGFDWFGGR